MTDAQIEMICEDPKTFLLRGRKAKGLIAAKHERIESWRSLASSITVELKPDSGGSSMYKQSLVENAAYNIVDLENEILAEIEALVNIEKEIHAAIELFVTDDRYKAVLELRYLNGYSWRSIGARLYYGEDWVCRLHGAALAEMRQTARIKSGYSAL